MHPCSLARPNVRSSIRTIYACSVAVDRGRKRATAADLSVFMDDADMQAAFQELLQRQATHCSICMLPGYSRHASAVHSASRTMRLATCGHGVCAACFATWKRMCMCGQGDGDLAEGAEEKEGAADGTPALTSRSGRLRRSPQCPCAMHECSGTFRRLQPQSRSRLREPRTALDREGDLLAGRKRRRQASYPDHASSAQYQSQFKSLTSELVLRTHLVRPPTSTLTDTCPACCARVWASVRNRDIKSKGLEDDAAALHMRLSCPRCPASTWCLRCGSAGCVGGACESRSEDMHARPWSRLVRSAEGDAVRVTDTQAAETDAHAHGKNDSSRVEPLVPYVLQQLQAQRGTLLALGDADARARVDPVVHCATCKAALWKSTACNELSHCRGAFTCNACGAASLPWEAGLPDAHWRDPTYTGLSSRPQSPYLDADERIDERLDEQHVHDTRGNEYRKGILHPCVRWDSQIQGVVCMEGTCTSARHDCQDPLHGASRARLQEYRIEQQMRRVEFEMETASSAVAKSRARGDKLMSSA